MKKIFNLKIAGFIIFLFTINNKCYSQIKDSAKTKIFTAKQISPCRYRARTSYTSRDIPQFKDSLIEVFFDSLFLRKSPGLTIDLVNQVINLPNSTEDCIFPLMVNSDSLFIQKAEVFGYPSPWSYSLSRVYCNYSNIKLMFLFYLENRYFDKIKVGDDQIISKMQLIKSRNKSLTISSYNELIRAYSKAIFSLDKKTKSPLKRSGLRWNIELEEVYKGWRRHLDG